MEKGPPSAEKRLRGPSKKRGGENDLLFHFNGRGRKGASSILSPALVKKGAGQLRRKKGEDAFPLGGIRNLSRGKGRNAFRAKVGRSGFYKERSFRKSPMNATSRRKRERSCHTLLDAEKGGLFLLGRSQHKRGEEPKFWRRKDSPLLSTAGLIQRQIRAREKGGREGEEVERGTPQEKKGGQPFSMMKDRNLAKGEVLFGNGETCTISETAGS